MKSKERQMNTKVQPITGLARAKALAAVLVESKIWFTFATKGPDEYEFTVKAEAWDRFSMCAMEAAQSIRPAKVSGHGKNAIQGIIVDALAEAYSTTAAAVENDLSESGADEDLASICELMTGQGY